MRFMTSSRSLLLDNADVRVSLLARPFAVSSLSSFIVPGSVFIVSAGAESLLRALPAGARRFHLLGSIHVQLNKRDQFCVRDALVSTYGETPFTINAEDRRLVDSLSVLLDLVLLKRIERATFRTLLWDGTPHFRQAE
jgi:hypothetical protein